jgi:23S rRNA pseudouridine955/2504/2580 synthase
MNSVQFKIVTSDEAGMRLDRWFRVHFPDITQGRLQKWLRKGEVRVNKKRKEANYRLESEDEIRIPPFSEQPKAPIDKKPLTENKIKEIQSWVLYKDENIIVLNKPAGLAVQGGTNQTQHIDAYLDALMYDAAERPRLVHRLDKDTSGVLIVARSRKAADYYTKMFRGHEIDKTYWAVTVNVPYQKEGKVSAPLMKRGGGKLGEKMFVDEDEGKTAITYYKVIDQVHDNFALLELTPETGRTHQLRVHCLELGCCIIGDGKYGGRDAKPKNFPDQLHLHAKSLSFSDQTGKELSFTAPLPAHIKETCEYLEWATYEV